MGTGVRINGAPSWNVPAGAGLNELYQQVLRQTGDQNVANEAVANAQRALDDIYNQTMISTWADEGASRAAQQRLTPQILRVAALLPTIQGQDTGRAGAALTEAMGVLEGSGLRDRTALYPWLNEHITDDGVLQAAGFDPAEVRKPPDTPWAHADLESLIALGRDMLERYVSPTGVRLTSAEIDSTIDQARTAARRLGVGSAFTAPAVGATAPAGTVPLTAFAFARRV